MTDIRTWRKRYTTLKDEIARKFRINLLFLHETAKNVSWREKSPFFGSREKVEKEFEFVFGIRPEKLRGGGGVVCGARASEYHHHCAESHS